MDANARRVLHNVARSLSDAHINLLALYALGQSMIEGDERDRYLRGLEALIEHMSVMNRIFDALLRPGHSSR